MPFTRDGIVPDIIINSHCIPSRMTVAQLLETVLGKACCMEGTFGDGTPFTSNSTNIAEQICDRLKVHGFERHANESLINGMTGEIIDSQVYIGPVFYQRLKHMVSDKLHCIKICPNTSVLTLRGWKTAYELNKDDLIATLKDGKLVYEKPIDIMIYPDYEGPMYYIKNQVIDLEVTGNHRMWVSKVHENNYDFARADEIVGKIVKYKKDADWEKEEYNITDEEIIIQADKCKEFPELIYSLSKRQAILFIKHFLKIETYLSEIKHYATSIILADQIQQLCLHIGWECNIEKDLELYIKTKVENPIIDDNSEEKFIKNEKCPVFCLQVPSEVFYVRRNGKTCWTGNSRSQGQYGRSNIKNIASLILLGNTDKLREHLVKSLILTYKYIRVLVNT